MAKKTLTNRKTTQERLKESGYKPKASGYKPKATSGGIGFTAVTKDKTGNVVSRRSGNLTPVTREEFVGEKKMGKRSTPLAMNKTKKRIK